jgi:hypothetical protein
MILDADELRDVDYIHWRFRGHVLDGVPDDDFDRYLWIAHAYSDWMTACTPDTT